MKKYLTILTVAIFIGMVSIGLAADVKISELPEATSVATTDITVVTVDPATAPTSKKITVGNLVGSAPAGSVKSNATTGVMQITGPAAGSTRVVTIPDANVTIPALPVSGPASPTAGMLTKWGASGQAIVDAGILVESDAATSGGPFVLGLTNENPAKQKEVTLDAHLSLTGTTAPALAVVTPEVDGSAHIHLTAAQMSGNGAVVYNTGQTNADVFLDFPTAAAGLSGLFTVGTTQAGNHWGVCTNAAVTDKIYLIAADGTVAAGDDDACVVMTAATIGQVFACWTFKTDAYDWMCKAISIAGSTFAAHATP
jgi:hypothetical protein